MVLAKTPPPCANSPEYYLEICPWLFHRASGRWWRSFQTNNRYHIHISSSLVLSTVWLTWASQIQAGLSSPIPDSWISYHCLSSCYSSLFSRKRLTFFHACILARAFLKHSNFGDLVRHTHLLVWKSETETLLGIDDFKKPDADTLK